MKNWKVRGTRAGQLAEAVVQANDWAAAAEAGSTAPHMLVVRDVVQVELPGVLMERLRCEHGFKLDRILTTVAQKEYLTAVGLKSATVRLVVPDNGLGQIWMTGEYQSEGRNALASCMAVMSQDADQETLYAHVDKFVQDVGKAISETYAGRLLKAA